MCYPPQAVRNDESHGSSLRGQPNLDDAAIDVVPWLQIHGSDAAFRVLDAGDVGLVSHVKQKLDNPHSADREGHLEATRNVLCRLLGR